MIVVRMPLNAIAPEAGPFALVYPTVLIATLFGRWQAGFVAWAVAFVWAWYFVLAFVDSFAFELPSDPPRVAINASACLIVLGLAELFRAAVARYAAESRASLDRRLVLMKELEHRTKNNFALVASLLETQRRREPNPAADAALDDAIGRVHAFAQAYSNLAMEQDEGAEVDMGPYLERIVERVGGASFGENVVLSARVAPISLPREMGVAIGLYLNEAITNCAKYAFPEGRAGRIDIEFAARSPEDWSLDIRDDGIGEVAKSGRDGGLGSNLMHAFARQAEGAHAIDFSQGGCRATLRAGAAA